jgi:hypothetical protein
MNNGYSVKNQTVSYWLESAVGSKLTVKYKYFFIGGGIPFRCIAQ